MTDGGAWSDGVLFARPPAAPPSAMPSPEAWSPGEEPGAPLLFVPDDLPDGPVGLLVLFHGAGSNPKQALPIVRAEAQRRGLLVLAPKSRSMTWDALKGGFGPDVQALDTMLEVLFERFPIDPSRIAVAGFSDGASYALSLGLINGDLFRRVMVFSGGYFVPGRIVGRPDIFVSHGYYDSVLPIEFTGMEIVRMLEADGFSPHWREFEGGHEAPYDVVEEAFALLF
jgi:phospholipase/carboxylesterase